MGMWPGAYWLKSSSSDALLADTDIICGGGGRGGCVLCGVMWLSLALAGCVLVRTLKYLTRQLKIHGNICVTNTAAEKNVQLDSFLLEQIEKKGTNRFGQYDFHKFLCREGRNQKKEHFIDLFPTLIITPNDEGEGRRNGRGGGGTTRDESGRWTMQGEERV